MNKIYQIQNLRRKLIERA